MRSVCLTLGFAAVLGVGLMVQPAFATPNPGPASTSTQVRGVISQSARIQPAELAKELHAANKPLVLQVGFRVMYEEAHIPGAVYAGPARSAAGLAALRKNVANVKKDQPIVIYCGCCPWPRCPNIRPAYKELKSLGFTRVKALYIADNFGTDWVHKGYPVAGELK